jgi:hypothetical protein
MGGHIIGIIGWFMPIKFGDDRLFGHGLAGNN